MAKVAGGVGQFLCFFERRTRKVSHFIELVVKELRNIELLLSNFEDKNKIDVYVLEYFIKKRLRKTIDMKGMPIKDCSHGSA